MPIVAAESDIALRDGSTVHVRPVCPEDVDRIERFLGELSDEARSFRFFSAATDLGQMARWFTDTRGGTSLLAVTSDDGHVVGHGQYFPDGTGGAEVAFAVANHWQGRGIATLLLAQLAEAAAAEGVRQFTAVVLTSNRKMIGTFRDSGFPVEVTTCPGELQVTFPTTLTEDGRRRFEERERTAAVAAVEHVLQPRSVAIVGASRRPGSIGAAVMANLAAGELHWADLPHQSPRLDDRGPARLPLAKRGSRDARAGRRRGARSPGRRMSLATAPLPAWAPSWSCRRDSPRWVKRVSSASASWSPFAAPPACGSWVPTASA